MYTGGRGGEETFTVTLVYVEVMQPPVSEQRARRSYPGPGPWLTGSWKSA